MPDARHVQDDYGTEALQRLGKRLQAQYDAVKNEPLPENLAKLMLALESQGKSPTLKGK